MNYDVAIIGLGPAGIEFAKESLKKGLKTIAFEKSSAGGTCLNLGCIPTKAMLACAEVFSKVNVYSKFNVLSNDNLNEFSFENLCKKRNNIVSKLSSAVQKDLEQKGLKIVHQCACLSINNSLATIISNGVEYSAKNIIVATGSAPIDLNFNSSDVLNSNQMLQTCALPKSILIIGSGAIGVEWARLLNSFGTKVYIVEKAQNLAPTCDKDISARLERIFRISKINFYKNTTVESFSNGVAKLSCGVEIPCDKILCAIGRKRVLPEFSTNFKLEIYNNCKTNVKNLFVAGDVSGITMLAHAASHQARALFNELYNDIEFNMPNIPSVIYGSPEIASIGINEQDIDDLNDYKIFKLPISYLAKSWCDDEIDGFIKIISHNDFIVGAHIISKEASALISQISIAMKAGLKIQDLEDVIFPHPTYSEGLLEAILNG